MSTFLKTLIHGALGIGALYVVGKICYEAGKEVAEAERQIESQMKAADTPDMARGADTDGDDQISGGEQVGMDLDDETSDKSVDEQVQDILSESLERNAKTTLLGRTVNRIKNLKLFMRAKKAFGGGERKPGVLATLLNNPEGAKIEAFIKNGGVQINVHPNAA